MSTTQPPIVVTESSGAQVLPNVNDERAHITAWCAHIACDADLRTTSPIWQGIASRLIVKAVSA
jgi:hypothetical protein